MAPAKDLFSVQGLVVVITGGGSGIGLMGALALDENGAKAVYIIGRREATLQAAAAKAKNGTLIPLVGDTTNKDDLERMAAKVKEEQGFVNVLWANAGTTGPLLLDKLPRDQPATVEQFKKAAWDVPFKDFTHTYAVNTAAPFYASLAFLELLDAGNRQKNAYQKSQVLITASIGGFNRLSQNGWAYQTSKAAAIHMAKMMATYFAAWKIRVNCLTPGLYPSEMTDGIFSFTADGVSAITEEGSVPPMFVPLERSGTSDDIAGAVLFMMSKAGSYLSGSVMLSDGGRISQVPSSY